jgi:hydrogenase nickel incorporation protein HypA/HybF
MHEYPVARQIVKIAEKHCTLAGAGKVTRITIVAGDYSGIVPESIDMYFGLISQGTFCEGAAIEIERVEPKLRCRSCGQLFCRRSMSFACPLCGGDGEPTEIGKEFYIKEIEVE